MLSVTSTNQIKSSEFLSTNALAVSMASLILIGRLSLFLPEMANYASRNSNQNYYHSRAKDDLLGCLLDVTDLFEHVHSPPSLSIIPVSAALIYWLIMSSPDGSIGLRRRLPSYA